MFSDRALYMSVVFIIFIAVRTLLITNEKSCDTHFIYFGFTKWKKNCYTCVRYFSVQMGFIYDISYKDRTFHSKIRTFFSDNIIAFINCVYIHYYKYYIWSIYDIWLFIILPLYDFIQYVFKKWRKLHYTTTLNSPFFYGTNLDPINVCNIIVNK